MLVGDSIESATALSPEQYCSGVASDTVNLDQCKKMLTHIQKAEDPFEFPDSMLTALESFCEENEGSLKEGGLDRDSFIEAYKSSYGKIAYDYTNSEQLKEKALEKKAKAKIESASKKAEKDKEKAKAEEKLQEAAIMGLEAATQVSCIDNHDIGSLSEVHDALPKGFSVDQYGVTKIPAKATDKDLLQALTVGLKTEQVLATVGNSAKFFAGDLLVRLNKNNPDGQTFKAMIEGSGLCDIFQQDYKRLMKFKDTAAMFDAKDRKACKNLSFTHFQALAEVKLIPGHEEDMLKEFRAKLREINKGQKVTNKDGTESIRIAGAQNTLRPFVKDLKEKYSGEITESKPKATHVIIDIVEGDNGDSISVSYATSLNPNQVATLNQEGATVIQLSKAGTAFTPDGVVEIGFLDPSSISE